MADTIPLPVAKINEILAFAVRTRDERSAAFQRRRTASYLRLLPQMALTEVAKVQPPVPYMSRTRTNYRSMAGNHNSIL